MGRGWGWEREGGCGQGNRKDFFIYLISRSGIQQFVWGRGRRQSGEGEGEGMGVGEGGRLWTRYLILKVRHPTAAKAPSSCIVVSAPQALFHRMRAGGIH